MKKKMQRAVQLAALMALTAMSSGVSAALTNEQLLSVLLSNGAINQQQYDDLTKLSKEDDDAAKKAIEDEVKVSMKGGHIKFKTADNEFKFQVGGRVMVDSAWYMANANTDPDKNWGNGTEIRRARIFLKGTVWDNWDFKVQYDFAGSGSLKDAYLRYTGLKQYLDHPLNITVGNFKEPFSLEELTSSKYITFMERGLPNAFAPSRNLGVAANSYGKVLDDGNWTAALGWFGQGITANNKNGQNEGNAVVGRVTFAPWASKTKVLHFGGAAEYRTYDQELIRIRERPEAHTANNRLVDTGKFRADSSMKWNVELAGVYGPFSVQGEFMQDRIDLTDYAEDVTMSGWYGYASWFITGESRKYSNKSGTFGRVKPKGIVGKGGWGAWEVAARYSNLDLNDGPITGYSENNATIGLNWYATPTIRFMANYVFAWSNNPGLTDPNIAQLRGQIDF
jgi:phosphate-selective porin OprO and OprP